MNIAKNEVPDGGVATQSPAVSSIPWVSLLWFAALMALIYTTVVWRLAQDWMIDEDMGHGFFVPLVVGYIVWQERDKWINLRSKPNYVLSSFFLIWGGAQLIVATVGAEFFLARTALIITLVGILFGMGGIRLVRAQLFVLFLLCFMIPLPAIIYSQITLRLQLFASSVAEAILTLIGIPVLPGNCRWSRPAAASARFSRFRSSLWSTESSSRSGIGFERFCSFQPSR